MRNNLVGRERLTETLGSEIDHHLKTGPCANRESPFD